MGRTPTPPPPPSQPSFNHPLCNLSNSTQICIMYALLVYDLVGLSDCIKQFCYLYCRVRDKILKTFVLSLLYTETVFKSSHGGIIGRNKMTTSQKCSEHFFDTSVKNVSWYQVPGTGLVTSRVNQVTFTVRAVPKASREAETVLGL